MSNDPTSGGLPSAQQSSKAAWELLARWKAIKAREAEPLDAISVTRYPGKVDPQEAKPRGASELGDMTHSEETDENMKKNVDLAKQLRMAVKRSGLTRNQIAKQTDLSYSVVHGFMAGRDIQLSTASKIAVVVGAELKPLRAKKAR